jgi:hypothetical protein
VNRTRSADLCGGAGRGGNNTPRLARGTGRLTAVLVDARCAGAASSARLIRTRCFRRAAVRRGSCGVVCRSDRPKISCRSRRVEFGRCSNAHHKAVPSVPTPAAPCCHSGSGWRRQRQRRSVLSRGNSVRSERNHAVQNQPQDKSRFARKHRGAGFDGVTVTLITPRRNDRGRMASTTPRQRKTTGRVMHESRADPEREHVHPSPA